MEALAYEYPKRGEVYLASVPFTVKLKEKRGALTAAEMQQIDERLRFCLGL